MKQTTYTVNHTNPQNSLVLWSVYERLGGTFLGYKLDLVTGLALDVECVFTL